MHKHDARSLSPDTKEALRKRAVDAHMVGGMKQCDVATALGVSPAVVCRWVKRFRVEGPHSLDARKKGPPKGTGARLTEERAAAVRRLIIDKCPEQLKLPFAL